MRTISFRPLTLAAIALAVLGAFMAFALVVPPAAHAQQASNPVRNLTLTHDANANSIKVTWDRPASGIPFLYRVSWTGPSSGSARDRALSHTISGAKDGEYTVSVEVWLSGDTGFGNSTSAKITVGAPPPPAEEETTDGEETQQPDNSGETPQLTLTQDTLNSIKATWDAPAPTNVYFYTLEWTGPTTGFHTQVVSDPRSHTISPIASGEYAVTIAAMYGGVNYFRVYASDTIAVSKGNVDNLTATAISPDKMHVSWEHPVYPSDITSYNVLIEDNHGTVVARENVPSSQSEYMVSGLSAETTYDVVVKTLRGNIELRSDASAQATTLATPGAITGLTAEGIVNGLSVSWTALPESENIASYRLDLDPNKSYQQQGPRRHIYDGNSHIVNGLPPGVAETVEVRACKFTVYSGGAHEYCGPSSTATGTPTAPSTAALAPGAPQNLRLTLTQSNSRLKVQWDAPATGWEPDDRSNDMHVYKYVVFLQDTETGKTVYKRPGHRKSQVIFRNVKSGATYEVSARARIQDGRPDSAQYGKWVASEWVTDTITVPSGGQEPSEDIGTQPHKLVWTLLQPNQPTPPTAVGEATRYVWLNPATQDWERFYPRTECKQYETFGERSYLASSKAGTEIRQARFYAEKLAESEADLEAQKEYRTAMLAQAGPNPSQQLIDYLDGLVEVEQTAVDRLKADLAGAEAKLDTKCDEVFPVDEGLTEADRRWVLIAKPPEEVEDGD